MYYSVIISTLPLEVDGPLARTCLPGPGVPGYVGRAGDHTMYVHMPH